MLRRLWAVTPPPPPAPAPSLPSSDPPKVAPPDAGLSEHARRNRAAWNADADDYQARHGRDLAGDGKAWGTWGIPESELGVLGEVAGRIVFCDHGAMNFADPYRTVPEVARLLRPGGCSRSAISRRSLICAGRIMLSGRATGWCVTISGCTGSTPSMRWCSSCLRGVDPIVPGQRL
jgi:hypothetical protein